MESDFLIASNGSNQKRRPYYYKDFNDPQDEHEDIEEEEDDDDEGDVWSERASYNRFLYYSRLRREVPDPEDSVLLIPSHIIPVKFFYPPFVQDCEGKQSSLVTIFSMWNTMLGTSLLSLPWAVEHAGVIPGLILCLLFAVFSYYIAVIILEVYEAHESEVITDFAILCKRLLGRWAQISSVLFSSLTIFGACIVYYVLMTNFLYHSGVFIIKALTSTDFMNHTGDSVYCPKYDNSSIFSESSDDSHFHYYWSLNGSVPIYLIFVLAPISCIQSPTFFTKFNSLGTLSVLYLVVFIITKWAKYGINVNFVDPNAISFTPLYKSNFPALAGTLSMAFFIHNCIITIMKNNRVKSNNKRDIGLAFLCVALTYFLLSGVFFIVYPLDKTCIEDNFLNNFRSWDIWSFAARIFLFFQLFTVFPLLSYICRVQVFSAITKREPTGMQVFFSTFVLISVCVSFAVFFPKIGTIIRFTGAICGLVYLFILPISLYLKWKSNIGELTKFDTIFHLTLLSLGFTNFILQFVISD